MVTHIIGFICCNEILINPHYMVLPSFLLLNFQECVF